MRLIIVRHGQTGSNLTRSLDTAPPGAPLTELGRRQAAALPRALAGQPIAAVFASDLLRARQSAEPLAASLGLRVIQHTGLREISAGSLEMRHDRDAIDAYTDTFLAWCAGRTELRMDGGASGAEVFARFEEALAQAAAATEASGTRAAGAAHAAAVVVSHGAVIRSWAAARVEGVSVEHAAEHPLRNTGAVVVEGDPDGGWGLVSWHEIALGGPDVDSGPALDPVAEPAQPSTRSTTRS